MTWLLVLLGWMWLWGFVATLDIASRSNTPRGLDAADWILAAIWPVTIPAAVVCTLFRGGG